MIHCDDCGTKLSSGICPNCQEEAFIYIEQIQDEPTEVSDEFMKLVSEQLGKNSNGEE